MDIMAFPQTHLLSNAQHCSMSWQGEKKVSTAETEVRALRY